jgi:replication factor C large subunit
MKNWTEKYRPTKFTEIIGQREAIQTVKNFLEIFPKSKKKALIFYGPPGTGKTALAHTAAIETGAEIFELNASDFRNKTKLQEILKPVLEQKSLISNNKLILVDEVDGISTYSDWGGLAELIRLIEKTPYPIILTANDIWKKQLADLRKKGELLKIGEVDYNTIKSLLIEILKKENKFINSDLLTSIAVKAKGDLRAAINDLQTLSEMKEPTKSSLDERNKEIDIFNALRTIFKRMPENEMLRVYDSVNMSLDEIMLWMEENIPEEYEGEELVNAIERLSRADIFKGRIYKQQYWRFLVYENILLSYGVSAAKKNVKTGFTKYKKPTRILKIWLNNQRIKKKKTIAAKYATYVHVSKKRALREFDMLRPILKNPGVIKELKLNQEEIEYLEK